MKRERLILLSLILFLLIPASARAQAWSGIIESGRAVHWSSVGIPGGIPSRTTICTTLSPGVTAAQITSAISACPNGQVVFLNAGTYHLSAGIGFKGAQNVTLRGAGPDKTFLIFTSGVNCTIFEAAICVAGSSTAWTGNPTLGGATPHNWTAGYAQGSTVLTFDSTSSWAVGQFLILDQFDDTTDTGGVFVGDTTGTYIQESIDEGRQCPDANDPSCGGTSGWRLQNEFKEITAISGTQVTISPGVYMPNWRTGQHPQAWSPGVVGSNVGTGLGVESLSVDDTNDTVSTSNMEIGNCYECWVENVRSIDPKQNHVWLYQSARAEVLNSYFYGTKNSASQSYGVEFAMTSDDLVQNNIFQAVTDGLMTGNTYGSVSSYNYTIDSFFGNVSGHYMAAAVFGNHDVSAMNLFEGNDVNQIIDDNIHGTANLETFFRNRIRGWDTINGATPTNATWAFDMMAHNRLANSIGNVLGTSGVQTVYQEVAPAGSGNCSTPSSDVYLLGWKTGCVSAGSGSIVDDPLTSSTVVRWGNYDVVNGAAQFNCSEVDSVGAVTFSNANACPATNTLPISFYLSSRPSWFTTPWGTPPWPPIGPDVTGGISSSLASDPDGLGGHTYRIPAQLCYLNSPIDSAYPGANDRGVLLFNANMCYNSSVFAPGPAANLASIVH